MAIQIAHPKYRFPPPLRRSAPPAFLGGNNGGISHVLGSHGQRVGGKAEGGEVLLAALHFAAPGFGKVQRVFAAFGLADKIKRLVYVLDDGRSGL
jgi:hypothetical protein